MKLTNLIVGLSIILGGFLLSPVAASAVGISPTLVDGINVDPGALIQFDFRVLNDSDKTKTFYFSTQNFRAGAGEKGEPEFVEEEVSFTSDLASWITTIQNSVEVAQRGEGKVNVVIQIPRDAEPGGHYGVIWAGEADPSEEGSVSIAGNVGLLVLINVSGDVEEGANIEEFNFLDRFHSRLPVEFYARIKNEGTVYFKPKGDVVIKGLFGNEVDRTEANPKRSNILPDSIRRIERILWEKTPDMYKGNFFAEIKNEWKNFGFGPYKAVLEMQYGLEGQSVTAETGYFWVIPWHLMLVAVLILVALLLVLKGYNKMVVKSSKKKEKNDE